MNSQIKRKMESNVYKQELNETYTKIIRQLKNSTTEATVAGIFENNLYSFIDNFFNKQINFHKEAGKNLLRHQFKGRIDAISNNLLIEYKDQGKLNTQKEQNDALSQIKNYLMQIYLESNETLDGILTNGEKISYIYFFDEELKHTKFTSFTVRDLDRIVKSLLVVGTKSFNPRNIVEDFKINSSTNLTRNLLNSLYTTFVNNKTYKTEMLFQEWQVLFRLSDSDQGKNQDIVKRKESLSKIFNTKISTTTEQYSALYILQTSYAIIVKLIASNKLSKLAFDEKIEYFSDLENVSSSELQKFVEKMEDGYVFNTGGIKNLLEGDFFSWYSDEKQWSDEIYKSLKEIISELNKYSSSMNEFEFSSIDIFKDLYMEIMPNEVRHSLGEYFTPSWLADHVVKNSINKLPKEKQNKWTAIDPTCGSGVFIVSLIKEILSKYEVYNLPEEAKDSLLSEILSRVHGIDLNPISVLTSRVSYMLAILPLVNDQKFEIPVYLGDSANIPNKIDIDGISCYSYTIETKKGPLNILFPENFVQSKGFSEIMYQLQSTIRAEDSALLYNQITDSINKKYLNSKIEKNLSNMSQKLVELHKSNWDGIWIRIASNFMLIARISNMDIICGNPPWVKWEYLPTNYAEKLKNNIDKRLFSGQTYMGAIALNICALIANTTSSAWLSKDGILAFLMPETILTQDSFEGFRDFYLENSNDRLYLCQLDDWTRSGNPFVVTQEKFMTFYYNRKKINYRDGLPVIQYKKKPRIKIDEINKFHSFDKVENFYEVSKGTALQIDDNRTGFTRLMIDDQKVVSNLKLIIGENSYKPRSGVEFTPAAVYFISPVEKTRNKNTYKFKVTQNTHSTYKSTYIENFELETSYIRPVIKGPAIERFKIVNENTYCIFPYEYGDRKSISIDKILKSSPLLTDYLLTSKSLIEKQSSRSRQIAMGTDFYALSKVGEYTFQEHKVAFRDNTTMNAAVVKEVMTPWGESVLPICAKHAPYISMDIDGNPITEEEAHYISGIYNTDIINKYYKTTFSGRSYSINVNIYIPKYDNENTLHQEISALSKKASESNTSEEIEMLAKRIESNYLEMCKNK